MKHRYKIWAVVAVALLGIGTFVFLKPTRRFDVTSTVEPNASVSSSENEAAASTDTLTVPEQNRPPAPALANSRNELATAQAPSAKLDPSPKAESDQPRDLAAADSSQPLPPAINRDESVATARMYAAHAPLRAPEIADPDSESSRKILGTMVAKALAQSAAPPPSQSPRN